MGRNKTCRPAMPAQCYSQSSFNNYDKDILTVATECFGRIPSSSAVLALVWDGIGCIEEMLPVYFDLCGSCSCASGSCSSIPRSSNSRSPLPHGTQRNKHRRMRDCMISVSVDGVEPQKEV